METKGGEAGRPGKEAKEERRGVESFGEERKGKEREGEREKKAARYIIIVCI